MKMVKKNIVLSTGLLLSTICGYAADQDKPNIVFILADDLGWNDLGYMGSDYYESPNIDRLAAEGMVFTNAYAAAANSAPSRACFMSGMYTPRHGIYTVSPSDRGDKTKRKLIPIPNTEDLRADFVTLGEALKAQGYTCGHVGKWHLGDDADGTGPLSQGFDLNIAGSRAGAPYSYFYPYCNKKKGACHIGLEQGKEGEYLTDRLTDEAIKYMVSAAKGDKPFFLYMSHHAVHTPIKAPADLVAKYEQKPKGRYHTNAVYAAMIESLDNSVGRLLNTLDSLGIAENTLVVFTSDNGGSEPVTDNFMLRGGKGMPYEGGIKVPMIVKWPGKTQPGSKSEEVVCNIDFYPTFLNIVGGSNPSLDGVDISGLFEGKEKLKDRDLFWHFPAYLQAYEQDGPAFRATPYTIIRSGKWKLIYYYETGSSELFDLSLDPKEEKDLSEKYPAVVKQLRNRLMKWIDETEAPIPDQLNPDYIAS